MSTGARVQLYSVRTRKLLRTISRFDDTVRSADIRPDGRVFVASDDSGALQVFDTSSRAILRTWREHAPQPAWVARFSPRTATTLLSAGDDRTVRLWDLPSEASVRSLNGHTDYVRTAAFMPGAQAENLVVSGSYDQTVRLWDSRAASESEGSSSGGGGGAVMTFRLPGPVETVLPMPSGTNVLVAAGNQIAVLDVVAGKPLQMISAHQKTVTALALASHGERVLAGGLDGHVKVLETGGWNVVAGSKYPSPILSLDMISGSGSSGSNDDDKHLAVGMQSGVLSVRTRLSVEQKVRERERRREMQALVSGTIDEHDRKVARERKRKETRGAGWDKKRLRGLDFVGEGADIVIDGQDRKSRKKERGWELDLRKGRYSSALDNVLSSGDKVSILTLLTALRHRAALRTALADRDEVTLQPVLKWVYKSIPDPRVVDLCVEVAMNILDLYAVHLGQETGIDALVERLHRRVREEVDRAQQAWMTRGMLDMLKQ